VLFQIRPRREYPALIWCVAGGVHRYVGVIKPDTAGKQRFVWRSFSFGSENEGACHFVRPSFHLLLGSASVCRGDPMISPANAVSSRFGTESSIDGCRPPDGFGFRAPIWWGNWHFGPYMGVIKPETAVNQRFVWCSFPIGSNDYRICDGSPAAVQRLLRR